MEYAFAIEPAAYHAFGSEEEQIDKCKEWGLLSEKASKTKTFYYKGNGRNESCAIVGYVDRMVAVIEFDNKRKHCIHPAYLKEMQAASFGQRYAATAESGEPEAGEAAAEADAAAPAVIEPLADTAPPWDDADADTASAGGSAAEAPAGGTETPAKPAAAKSGKAKAGKVALPEDKVPMTATVKEFTTVPNHFTEEEDEVVIYEAVSIVEPATELGAAWSSYSNTLKKLELEVGDTILFDAKVVAKKLTKHPVPYKINNPSKIKKA